MTKSRQRVAGMLAGLIGLLGLVGAPARAGAADRLPQREVPAERTRPEAVPLQAEPIERSAGQDDGAASAGAPSVAPSGVEAAARREALLRVSARGVRVRVGGDVTIGEHERVHEVVTLFGRTEVMGIVTGDLFTLGGDVHLGPNALVRGEIVVIGGVVRAEQGAYVGGRISEMSLSASDIRLWLPDDHEVTIAFQPDWPRIARIVFVSGIMGTLFWFVVCAVLLAIAPGAVARARQRASVSPVTALAIGLFAELLFLPAMAILAVVLSISIIGLPLLALLPILALAFALALAVGFTSVAAGIGGRLVGRATPIAALVLGLAVIWGTGLAGRYMWTLEHGRLGWGVALLLIGTGIEFLACTLGLGATLLSWAENRRRTPATPAPATPVVPPIEPPIEPIPQGL